MITENSRVGRAFRRVCGPDADIYEAGAVSEQSWLSYDSGVTNWAAFASQRGLAVFPATTEALKAWIRWMVDEEYSAATIDCYMTAVSIAHDEREMPINRRALRKVLKAAREDAANASPPRKAAPLRAADAKALLKACDIKRPADCRDAPRPSPACSAGCARTSAPPSTGCAKAPEQRPAGVHAPGPRRLRGHPVEVQDQQEAPHLHDHQPRRAEPPEVARGLAGARQDRTRHAALPRRRSLAAHLADPPQASGDLRHAPAAHEQLLLARGMKPGEAYLEAQRCSGHSMRAGLVTEVTDRGVPLHKMQDRSRHKDIRTLLGYVRIAEDRRDSAVKGLKL